MRTRRVIAALLTGAVGLAAPAMASGAASAYTQVLQSYQASGTVPPCRFTSAELAAALHGIDTYGQQYFADFSDAIQSALTQRAAGACAPAAHRAASAGSAPQAPLPASVTSPTNGSVPLPMLLLAGLAVAVVLIGGAALIFRGQGWDPEWAAAWRHAWAEAGYRMAGRLSDAADRWHRR